MYLTQIANIPVEAGLYIAKDLEHSEDYELLIKVVNSVNNILLFIMPANGDTRLRILHSDNKELKNYIWYGPIVLLDKE